MLHILICDDEPAFVDRLRRHIEALPDFNGRAMLIRCTTKPRELSEAMLREADIVFLDIDMGDVNGMALARGLREVRRDSVLIFVTNYGEYAAEGYEVNAFRFLPKLRLEEKLPKYFQQALAECRRRTRTITVFSDGESISVRLDELAYVNTEGRMLVFHFAREETPCLRSRMTLQALEKQLAEYGFLRIHKSHLVNMKFVTSMQTKGAVLTTGKTLPLSLHNYRAIKTKYLEWKGTAEWSTL